MQTPDTRDGTPPEHPRNYGGGSPGQRRRGVDNSGDNGRGEAGARAGNRRQYSKGRTDEGKYRQGHAEQDSTDRGGVDVEDRERGAQPNMGKATSQRQANYRDVKSGGAECESESRTGGQRHCGDGGYNNSGGRRKRNGVGARGDKAAQYTERIRRQPNRDSRERTEGNGRNKRKNKQTPSRLGNNAQPGGMPKAEGFKRRMG